MSGCCCIGARVAKYLPSTIVARIGGALLSHGRLEGEAVRCMYHGIKYDGTGKCGADTRPGHDSAEIARADLSVIERNHFIWIWMGEPAKADPAQMVDLPYLGDPHWKGIPAYLHYKAHYLLIVDNLSDFSHLAFVHTRTLGGSEEYAFDSKPTAIERLERGVSSRALASGQPSAAVPPKGDSQTTRPSWIDATSRPC